MDVEERTLLGAAAGETNDDLELSLKSLVQSNPSVPPSLGDANGKNGFE